MYERSGAIAVVATLLFTVLLLASGGAIDYGIITQKQSQLQSAADAAALAGAKRLSFAGGNLADATEITNAVVKNYLALNAQGAKAGGYSSETKLGTDPLVVRLTLKSSVKTHFLAALGITTVDLEIKSAAQVIGQPNICLLTLDTSADEAIKIDKESRTQGNNCAVFSNSLSSRGVAVKNKAAVSANNVCSAGGFDLDGSINPTPMYDCPQYEDPLNFQQAPYVGNCNFTNLKIKDEVRILRPGVYCGGLKIEGSSNITLEPGLYAIKDGKFEVKGSSSLKGKNVSIFLDKEATLKFDKKTSITLEASKAGAIPGILIFASRQQSIDTKHKIESQNAQIMVGTLYFPTSTLEIGSFYSDGANVGSAAAYTAIVANKVKVKNKSSLVLNSDYALTDVPVPEGIRGVAQPVRLVE
ncbi:MAG: pilus assembly protein TadG-related protein [Filomicrobium sp.]